MQKTFSALAIATLFAVCAQTLPAFATSDDAKWVKQCVDDNKDQGAKPEVVAAYCSCMNSKMSADETQSITQWEKTHETERKACDAEAGWK